VGMGDWEESVNSNRIGWLVVLSAMACVVAAAYLVGR